MSTNSTESSHSPSPAGLNAPRYGTMVPKRIFVGGISANTTESELHELFSRYGVVTNAKIILDRAGVSKGYGFVTFETDEDAQRAQASGNNIMLRDRRLNIAPAIRKQPFSRVYDPTQSVQPGTILYQNGVPYMYHNGTAFFHPDALTYQYSPPAATQTSTAAVATANTAVSGYPVVYQPSVYYPQQAFQYPNVWNAPNGGQWRWAPPATSHPAAAHPAYLYPTTLVSLGSGGNPASNEGQEYQDPAIVETGSEVGAAMMPSTPMRKPDDSGGTPSSLLASASTAASLGSFWTKGPSSPSVQHATSTSNEGTATPTAQSPLLGTDSSVQTPRRPRELAPRQRRYTAPPEALLSLEEYTKGSERDLLDGQPQSGESSKHPGSGATWRDCLFGTPPTPCSTRSQCP
ncbi:protein boule-like isoform X2 [Rhipicephalus sanguineus]|uniref:protein boule-like isoform X3 n=1 Tax=Rhipicephalus sanguineus TaxID=34632 RepID=UPI0018933952|nr:protein boule-like isoform X3 [Rhipicephalus sanguineus]XP_049269721.1 protein boule-like isoform X2 [Rhipicephalus sanguineus]